MIKASGLRTDFICRRLFSESFSLRQCRLMLHHGLVCCSWLSTSLHTAQLLAAANISKN